MSDYITFMGTAGARFVVSRQLRSSAGIWCNFRGQNILIDPGPGTLSRCFSIEPKLNPAELDAILLSHRHLDHSTDINVMAEAMTNGTYIKRGTVFLPESAITPEPVLYEYLRNAVEKLVILRQGGCYKIGENIFTTPVKHIHPVENYGFLFDFPYGKIAFITDTDYFPELTDHYKANILIMNVVLFKSISSKRIQHLDLEKAREIILKIKPVIAVLTHFGTTMLDNNPDNLAKQLSLETGTQVISARDGFTLYPDHYLNNN